MVYTDIYKFNPVMLYDIDATKGDTPEGVELVSLKKMFDEMEIMFLLEHDNPANTEEQRTALLAKAMLVYEIRDRLGLSDVPDEEVAKQYPVSEKND